MDDVAASIFETVIYKSFPIAAETSGRIKKSSLSWNRLEPIDADQILFL